MTRLDALFEKGWARADQIQGWFMFDDLKVMLKLALQVPEGGTIVEVGVWKGKSFVGMGVATEGRRHVAVDHFRGSDEAWHREDPDVGRLREMFEANLGRFGMLGRTEVIEEESVKAAQGFDDESIDLLLLDGSHKPDDIAADIGAWWPKIKRRGWMAFHDWEKPWVQEIILKEARRWRWMGMEKAPYLYVARKRKVDAKTHLSLLRLHAAHPGIYGARHRGSSAQGIRGLGGLLRNARPGRASRAGRERAEAVPGQMGHGSQASRSQHPAG